MWMQLSGIAPQKVQTYLIDRQTFEERIPKECAAGRIFTKVSGCLKALNTEEDALKWRVFCIADKTPS
ncbi:MAG: hypothetical protein Q4G42_08665 [Neisseria sp.]|nr:hypothetical protein [Neisseria sp.]